MTRVMALRRFDFNGILPENIRKPGKTFNGLARREFFCFSVTRAKDHKPNRCQRDNEIAESRTSLGNLHYICLQRAA
jgi:hypothetical protein